MQADRKFKRPFGATPIPRRSGPQHGGARLSLVLDRRLRMGEGSASGVPWGAGLGKGGWERTPRKTCFKIPIHYPLLLFFLLPILW